MKIENANTYSLHRPFAHTSKNKMAYTFMKRRKQTVG